MKIDNKSVEKSGGNSVHELKIQPEYFEAVKSRRKNFEIRKNDRGYKVGDKLLLREFVPANDKYTSRCVERTVTYITNYAQKEDFVVLSIS